MTIVTMFSYLLIQLNVCITESHFLSTFQNVLNVLIGRFEDHFLLLSQLWSGLEQHFQFAA